MDHRKHDAALAAFINRAAPEPTIHVVLTKTEADKVRRFYSGCCRLLTPRSISAYMRENYFGSVLGVWVMRTVHPSHLPRDYGIYQMRKHVLSVEEQLAEHEQADSAKSRAHGYFLQCVLHRPNPEERERSPFDMGSLTDLPPDGYPLSSTPIEGIRNLLVKRDPGSWRRRWATHQWRLHLQEAAEERHAQRVLDNERAQEFSFSR